MSLPSTPSHYSSRGDECTTPSKTKAVDLGRPLGVYDTNTVRDRVRQWQAQGGGVITADDVGIEENAQPGKGFGQGKTPRKAAMSRTLSKSNRESRDSPSPSRAGARTSKVGDEKKDRNRSGSAPAKRVVSDGHWRKKRSPPKSPKSSRVTKNTALKGVQPDDGIRAKPTSESKADARRKREDDRGTPKRENVGGEDGIRVYVTPPESCRASGHHRRRSGHLECEKEDKSDIEAARSDSPEDSVRREKRPTPQRSPRVSSSTAREGTRRRRGSIQKAHNADDSPRSTRGEFSDGRGSTRSHGSNILSHVFGDSRRIFSKQALEPIPTPRVPSIEAWLNETPDPFLDADEPPVEEIAPLKPSSEKTMSTPQETTVEDPNRIWEALDTKEGTRRAVNGSRRRKRIPSSAIYEDNPFPIDFDSESALSGPGNGTTSASKFVDLVHEASPETSPSSLTRRLARKSISSPIHDRRKSRIPRESGKEEADTASVSNLTASSVEGPDPNNPLRPPGLNIKRPFPSTGNHRLSTIASVETFNTKQGAAPASISDISERTVHPCPVTEDETGDEVRDHFDPNSLKRNNSRLTKHADLISVLSLPRAGNRSIQSARSIRTNRSRLATATMGDLMQELATDESKYMRELRTLVDGVIPVLLSCVLSKSDSAIAAGLFRPSANAHEDPNFTRPIVDMGIALERLKTLHKRIPQGDAAALLTWAHGAQRVYSEYLKAWRMGFQDVVVNLAPATEDGSTLSSPPSADPQGLEEGLPRNEDGDVVNGDGERVDVAFLLKRPLLRLKYLAKTLKGIHFLKPSADAESLSTKYQKLVDDARQRSNEERARLEDEAASNIDSTRARDPKTLAPLIGVAIDRTRRVRARDHFNLRLQHSSGQRVDCRVELLLRDEASDVEEGGDLLICEIDGTGRWLLFPPVQFSQVSARNGDLKGEIVIMVRGVSGNGTKWQELFSLRSEDEQAGFEWVQMLGLTPVPPKIIRTQSFLSRHQIKNSAPNSVPSSLELPLTPTIPIKSRTPSPREVEVPIGEPSNDASKAWTETPTSRAPSTLLNPSLRDSAEVQKQSYDPLPSTLLESSNNYVDQVNNLRSLPSQTQNRDSPPAELTRPPRSFKEALGLSGTSTSVGLRRTRAKRLSRNGGGSPSSPKSTNSSRHDSGSRLSSPSNTRAYEPAGKFKASPNDIRSLSPGPRESGLLSSQKPDPDQQKENIRPLNNRSMSSVPSLELPYIPKARKNSPPTTSIIEQDEEPEWPSPAEPQQPRPSSKLTKMHPGSSKAELQQDSASPSAIGHRSPSPIQLKGSRTPVLSKSQVKPRRSSSPLKHEYEPSTASESSSDSETSTMEHNEATSISDSSEDEELEEEETPTPLMPLGVTKRISKPFPRSLYSTPNGTIKPSESASQAPYKTVPAQPTKASKTIASIFSWSDTGSWQSLHPDECSIVITPGLIEAYEMSAAHSTSKPLSSPTPIVDADSFSDLTSNLTSQNDEVQCDRPLVVLELTPLVPLRRGTAIDISIRSPPTPNSQITSGNNIMFRSRNPEECEALYALINHSRINNPTFIALQNARASGNSFAASADRRLSTSGSRSSWFGGWGRSSSYRASSAPTPSIAPSESSIGSMSSAFSALRRFGRTSGGGMFNISRSTITSREGSRANSVYTSSENSSGSGTSSPIPPGLIGAGKDAQIGLSNAKIRLYIRETASRWRDMGSARLTIMRPENKNVGPDGRPMSSTHQGTNEKRIVINGKTKGEVLLDVQLGESSFERVARTGIALSVWEDVIGPNGEVGVVGAVGGVSGGRAKVYMIQVCDRLSSKDD